MLRPAAPEVAQQKPEHRLLVMRLGIVRRDRDRPRTAFQRLVEPPEILQRDAAIGQRGGIVRLQRDGAIVSRQRFLEAVEFV